MTQCTASPMGGGQCERDAGHEGKHRKLMPSGRSYFEWTDISQDRFANEHGSRFD